MQFGNYVLQSYTPATNSEFVLGGQGCDLNTTGNI
jgi:hypothetical protein